ncbi:UvrD-helicase domain-containing protein [Verminephrobacter aporrectodeae]|uniref:UvrD-helicase domain-containing protein n=1 Tax=Verminephrobacter aporrectodeae TaxID=1110389 RepID=UPI00224342CC|nr:UvrD-helicase domain-containing protein [Verminephrobacter aporrectodeae]MCW8176112.1 ATP-dependent helicase [Verminephrobacter aporrectodeae subsp. tuberculatae]MCW8203077.1 ATP-dependent helicase [Verminephrobacter aporrectodeae subsp. tuberculatae]
MINPEVVASGDEIDASVDLLIQRCLNVDKPQSFFLFAGAGSGKTRTLVSALEHVRSNFGEALRLKGQRVGVITYTNAASEEIKRRLAFDPIIDVSTIHSFAWSLINGLNRDIREWLRTNITEDIEKIVEKDAKGRKSSDASEKRQAKITSKTKRLENLDSVKRFVYSSTGENRERNSLNHAEVIQITSCFLETKPAMQSILVGRYPILLIDESQDTNKHLINALFKVQAIHKDTFVLGLLGDMMQRIYSDGRDGLGSDLPADWAKPEKQMNYRCPKRIITLINKVRSATDGQVQQSRPGCDEGCVRLFVLPSNTDDKLSAELKIAQHMAKVTNDEEWKELKRCKNLTLEHRMAASRMGFSDMFIPLYEIENWRTTFLTGKLPAVQFFSNEVLPLIKAKRNEDRFAVARIVRKLSPLLSAEVLRTADDQRSQLQQTTVAIDKLISLFKDGADPTFAAVLNSVVESNLLSVPESLQLNASSSKAPVSEVLPAEASEDDRRATAIENFLSAPFSQIEYFSSYVSGKAHFDTHQGVKGLEFDRVMVIMDDKEARGFMFKYESLFGGKSIDDSSVQGVRRLFYVICSRARKSLALVAYTESPDRVRQFVLDQGWFAAEEIIMGVPS